MRFFSAANLYLYDSLVSFESPRSTALVAVDPSIQRFSLRLFVSTGLFLRGKPQETISVTGSGVDTEGLQHNVEKLKKTRSDVKSKNGGEIVKEVILAREEAKMACLHALRS
ncbi:hypothetical protein M404DRAFT_36065 [Pisolithus tinctorius Marx 270]|uniref:Uncharacterized protein n=1 Tax=Pisolithus tinctorius Marx 270 TaxID=870435 RepID=A0A0C3ND23_PISTI|nr:hypothetical protein M404DRAFT_36065 [Pisolithus tinctorius Marx 270]